MRKEFDRVRRYLLRCLGGIDRGTHERIVAKEVRYAHERIATLAYRYALNDAIEACAREQSDQVARLLRRVLGGEAPAVEMTIANRDKPDVVRSSTDAQGFTSYILHIPSLHYRFVVKEAREVRGYGRN